MTKSAYSSPDDAERAFYRAFATVDLAAMAAVWLHAEQARCVHPGGDLLQGYAAVMRSWGSIFGHADRPRVQYQVVDRLGADGLSIHIVEEHIGPAGADTDLTRVLATNTYLRTEHGWQMVMHHATLPLIESPPGQGPGDVRKQLH